MRASSLLDGAFISFMKSKHYEIQIKNEHGWLEWMQFQSLKAARRSASLITLKGKIRILRVATQTEVVKPYEIR